MNGVHNTQTTLQLINPVTIITRRTKISDANEVRNEFARKILLKNTQYKRTNFNISFNYLENPQLQKRLAENQGKIQFNIKHTYLTTIW